MLQGYALVLAGAPSRILAWILESSPHLFTYIDGHEQVVAVVIVLLYSIILTLPLVFAVKFRLSGKRKAFLICALMQTLFVAGHVIISLSRFRH